MGGFRIIIECSVSEADGDKCLIIIVLKLVESEFLLSVSFFVVGWSEIPIRLSVSEVGGVKITKECSVFEVCWSKMPIRNSVF